MAAGPPQERNQDATVYVGGLDEKVTEAILWELFLQAGPVVNTHMPKDRVTQMHQGYGFIEFMGEEDADYAIKVMNMIKIYGKPIRVNKASAHQKNLDVGANIFIGNLDPEIDEKLLFDTFSAFGVILQTPKIMRDPDTGNSKGFAFINFASFEAADAAIEAMNGQYLCNRAITISFAFKKDSKGERHGSAAERLLAKQNPLAQADRPHQLFADAPPTSQSIAANQAAVAAAVAQPPPPPPTAGLTSSTGLSVPPPSTTPLPPFPPTSMPPPPMGMPPGMPPPPVPPSGMPPMQMPPAMPSAGGPPPMPPRPPMPPPPGAPFPPPPSGQMPPGFPPGMGPPPGMPPPPPMSQQGQRGPPPFPPPFGGPRDQQGSGDAGQGGPPPFMPPRPPPIGQGNYDRPPRPPPFPRGPPRGPPPRGPPPLMPPRMRPPPPRS
ncbi:Splicing factor 3B subunit 4 [Holothuria leucospilota]|uniref:Splicing factor 3B subunit 4 n=1 Tax=Holothuria leucospilota TaxID=206669 RepID=A0A9Q1BDS0_HOLLE|nr:Splicing factor 3B subunit 4 [Holothuria leucospilota]